MFQAIRYPKMQDNKIRNELQVQNIEGKYCFSDEMKAKTIAECFRDETIDPEGPIYTFKCVKAPNCPIR